MNSTTSGIVYDSSEAVYESVKIYYGKVLSSTKDLKTNACTAASKPHPIIRQIISKQVPEEINNRFYGCGDPIPLGIEGLTVVDLGSGSGRDCYIATGLVGPNGKVIGVDMTDEQLLIANKFAETYCIQTLKYPTRNLWFKKGYIEFLEKAGIEKESVDLVISNCVVNLSPNKPQVLQSVYNALKFGGEFYFSDVYCSRRLPENVRSDELLFGECIGGALYINDFENLARKVGFTDPRIISKSEIIVSDPQMKLLLGEAKFYSITYRLFKLKNLEPQCEDYGQIAYYKGTIKGMETSFKLDDHHVLEKGRPLLVCGNTASMLQESWLKPHFTIIGDRSVHYGQFNCSGGNSTTTPSDVLVDSCFTGGSCCG